jgi:hypothetical protein
MFRMDADSKPNGGRPPQKAEYVEGPEAARRFDEAMSVILSVSKEEIARREREK